MSFEQTLAALGTAIVLGFMSGWMSRPSNRRYALPTDYGCVGVLLALLALVLASGMILGKLLL